MKSTFEPPRQMRGLGSSAFRTMTVLCDISHKSVKLTVEPAEIGGLSGGCYEPWLAVRSTPGTPDVEAE